MGIKSIVFNYINSFNSINSSNIRNLNKVTSQSSLVNLNCFSKPRKTQKQANGHECLCDPL